MKELSQEAMDRLDGGFYPTGCSIGIMMLGSGLENRDVVMIDSGLALMAAYC